MVRAVVKSRNTVEMKDCENHRKSRKKITEIMEHPGNMEMMYSLKFGWCFGVFVWAVGTVFL